MKPIKIQSPTRIDLAGGTLDLWPLYNFVGRASTVNLAIDIFTEVEIQTRDKGVELHLTDLKLSKTYPDIAACLKDADPAYLFLRVVLREFEIPANAGFSLSTRSQSPVGGGLGGSSSLLITLMKAMHASLGLKLPAPVPLVNWAHNLEAQMIHTPTGTQDYFPPVAGGLNYIHFNAREMTHEAVATESTPFGERMLLVYTGRSHHSGLNNFEVLKSAVAKDAKVMNALAELRDIASALEAACRSQKWNELTDLFKRELQARLQLTPAFSCPEIVNLESISKENGAEAIKICGAGGGGCVMIWSPAGRRETIAQACEKAGFQVLNARPVSLLR